MASQDPNQNPNYSGQQQPGKQPGEDEEQFSPDQDVRIRTPTVNRLAETRSKITTISCSHPIRVGSPRATGRVGKANRARFNPDKFA